MEIKKAERKKTKFIGCLYGFSGSGKTYSALRLAKGLGGKIGFIDTENRRASLYDNFGFDVIDLEPPFIPERIIEAIETFEEANYDVIIIDSITHEWEGTGGCCEIADDLEKKMGHFGKWGNPKMRHKKMMNKILQCKSHLIICCRAKELIEQDGKTLKSLGMTISQEKNFKYEMLTTFYLKDKIPVIEKCPVALVKEMNIAENEMINEKHGQSIKTWLEGGKEETINEEELLMEMTDIAKYGTNALIDYWESLPTNKKKILEPHKELAKNAAKQHDEKQSKTSGLTTEDTEDINNN